MLEIPLVIWVNSPPYVESGAFTYVEKHWPGGVVYAVLGALREERAAMGWGPANPRTGQTRVRGDVPVSTFCGVLLNEFPDALHLVAGMSSVTGNALSHIVEVVPPERIAVFSERPGAHGPLPRRLAKSVIQPIKYRRLVLRYRRKVGLLLPLGLAGVERFRRYGWPTSRMAPFMYCPTRRDSATAVVDPGEGPVRFLYVGRLSRYAKGTDILVRALEGVRGEWRLTVVGGHGDWVGPVRTWAESRANVEVMGPTAPHGVWEALAQHHVCVVPSRVDGWNVVVNESLYAHRGLITTDSVASDELVRVSGAGRVVPAGSVSALTSAMQSVVDDRSLVITWAKAAECYADRIAPHRVGAYLMDLMFWLGSQSESSIPAAPWLKLPSSGAEVGKSK